MSASARPGSPSPLTSASPKIALTYAGRLPMEGASKGLEPDIVRSSEIR
jgi:hypothetical protein